MDISEADKYTALSMYYFGHHPANRFEFSHGRDLAPDPAIQARLLRDPRFERALELVPDWPEALKLRDRLFTVDGSAP